MKCLWQELQENRRALREDFKELEFRTLLVSPMLVSFYWQLSRTYSMMVNSFCREFLLVLHTLCWLCGEYLLHAPVLVYMGSFSYMASAGLRVEFLLHTPCWLLYVGNFFFTKQNEKNVKVNKNVHNWVMLHFKAEADIQYRLHKVASCLPADSAEINTSR